jgi:hypothetical protein
MSVSEAPTTREDVIFVWLRNHHDGHVIFPLRDTRLDRLITPTHVVLRGMGVQRSGCNGVEGSKYF